MRWYFEAGHTEWQRRTALLSSVIVTTVLGSPAIAQTEPTSPLPPNTQLVEIVVTAQKRETLLQDTPIAVSAVSGDTIQSQRLVNLSDIAARIPSITFDQVNRSESFISIRGTTIGNDAAGIDQGVSVFIDDVPTTGFGDNSPDLYDLQSVEVLRGPQGTLFGRNVTGGAVLLRTLPPSFQAAGRGTITYGSNNLVEVQGYVTGPLVPDILAGKLAADVRRRDNYLTNIALHDKTYGDHLGSIRGQLLWNLTPDFKVLLGADYLDDTSPAKAQWVIGNFQPSLFPTLNYGPEAVNQGSNARMDKKVGGVLARLEGNLPFATLTSVTGYRNVDESLHFSTTGDPFNSIISDPITRDDQVSEELRLTSPSNQRLTWVGGVFLLKAHRSYLQTVAYDAQPGTRVNVLARFVPGLVRFLSPYVSHANQHVTLDSEAAYGEATFAIIDTLKLTAGGRYSNETKTGHTELFDTSVQNPNISTGKYSKTWGAFTPKILLSYEPTRSFLAYVSATNGFESGGYDANGTTKAELASAYNPEHVWSYETGVKTTLFDRRMHLNLAIYDAEYKDLQTRNFDPISGLIIAGNAAQATVRGAELEGDALLANWLTLGLAYSYTDAKYGSYLRPNPGGAPTNYSGHTIPFTPRNALNVNAEARFGAPVGSGQVRAGGDITFRSTIRFDDANSVPDFVVRRSAFRGLLNLHAIWSSEDNRTELTVWAKNVNNKRAVINSQDLSNLFDTVGEFNSGGLVFVANYNESRTVGISLTQRF
jgi:iron complex outermembrane receptor protein